MGPSGGGGRCRLGRAGHRPEPAGPVAMPRVRAPLAVPPQQRAPRARMPGLRRRAARHTGRMGPTRGRRRHRLGGARCQRAHQGTGTLRGVWRTMAGVAEVRPGRPRVPQLPPHRRRSRHPRAVILRRRTPGVTYTRWPASCAPPRCANTSMTTPTGVRTGCTVGGADTGWTSAYWRWVVPLRAAVVAPATPVMAVENAARLATVAASPTSVVGPSPSARRA